MMLRCVFLLSLSLALAACATGGGADALASADAPIVEMLPPDPIPTNWRQIVTDQDLDRLNRASAAWETALAEAVAAGFGRAIDREEGLLDPDAALARAAPSPGRYRCRVVKLGSESGKRPFTAYKAFTCFVEAEGALLTIVKANGSERPAGRLWTEEDDRMVFLGAMELDQEDAPPAYAADAARDRAGFVERVAPFRWRMVVPWPPGDSKLDVFELVPIAALALDPTRSSP